MEERGVGNKAVFATNLRRYMQQKGIKAKDLSKQIDVPYTTVLRGSKQTTTHE